MESMRHNRLFKEWYYGSGCGEQNLCGKTELEKIESAFVEGMKVAHAEMNVGMKSTFVMLFRKDDAWK